MIDLSQETETLARRLAEARHATVDVVVREALEVSATAAGVPVASRREASAQAIAARRECPGRFADDLAAMPILDKRPVHEIIDDLNAV
jgi:antitoxin VapB